MPIKSSPPCLISVHTANLVLAPRALWRPSPTHAYKKPTSPAPGHRRVEGRAARRLPRRGCGPRRVQRGGRRRRTGRCSRRGKGRTATCGGGMGGRTRLLKKGPRGHNNTGRRRQKTTAPAPHKIGSRQQVKGIGEMKRRALTCKSQRGGGSCRAQNAITPRRHAVRLVSQRMAPVGQHRSGELLLVVGVTGGGRRRHPHCRPPRSSAAIGPPAEPPQPPPPARRDRLPPTAGVPAAGVGGSSPTPPSVFHAFALHPSRPSAAGPPSVLPAGRELAHELCRMCPLRRPNRPPRAGAGVVVVRREGPSAARRVGAAAAAASPPSISGASISGASMGEFRPSASIPGASGGEGAAEPGMAV
eukprot:scaffold3010_cov76-Isochrysis_galbana.AAC.2